MCTKTVHFPPATGMPAGLVVRSGRDVRAYMGDVGTPTGLVVRSGGGERAYMGDVSTPARSNLADNHYKCCKKNPADYDVF